MSKIIAVSDNPDYFAEHIRALKEAGHHVCTARNMTELIGQLTADHCDLVHIGFSVPPEEKRRIVNSVRHYFPHCSILEVYEDQPFLQDADAHVHKDTEPSRLLLHINQLLAA